MQFNELVGNIVNFDVHGTKYKIKLRKERKKTCYYYGDRLAELIVTENLSEGDLLHFNMAGPQPRISIVYFGNDDWRMWRVWMRVMRRRMLRVVRRMATVARSMARVTRRTTH